MQIGVTYSYPSPNDFFRSVIKNHDLIIEGGIGKQPFLYRTFRDLGYTKKYMAINDEKVSMAIPENMEVVIGDCFNPILVDSIINKYGSISPCMVTNSFLYSCFLFKKSIEETTRTVQRITETKLRSQIHRHPTKSCLMSRTNFYASERDGFEMIHGIYTTDKEKDFSELVEFLKASENMGWRYSLAARDTLFMERK